MKRSVKYRQQKAEAAVAADAILAAAEANGGDLTAEQKVEFDGYRAKLATLQAAIEREEEIERAEKSAPVATVTEIRSRAEADKRRGFATPQEFLLAAMAESDARSRADVSDERLRPLAVVDDDKRSNGALTFLLPQAFTPRSIQAAAGSDEAGEYSDSYGGHLVPTTRIAGLLQVGFEGDPTAGLTQALPMATPSVELPARVDKDHSTSVAGGFTVGRRAEVQAPTSSRGQYEMVTMKAATLMGLSYATEELLNDSPISFAAIIDQGFRTAFPAKVLNEKIRGAGGDQFTGVLNAGCLVTVSKETGQAADTINAKNVIKMAARCWGYGNAVWLTNHDCRPELMQMSVAVGTSGQLIYTPSPTMGFPDMLLGRPIYYSEYASKLGDVGDLILGNWSQFLEGTYQPLQSAESVHVRFLNNERTFRFSLRNCGAPWWRSALTPATSSATLSPFVTLEAR